MPAGTPAEAAYLFRHALLRDAAYEMQLPADRARLHALAIDSIESGPGRSELEVFAHCRAANAIAPALTDNCKKLLSHGEHGVSRKTAKQQDRQDAQDKGSASCCLSPCKSVSSVAAFCL